MSFISLFFVAFFINLFYELLHSILYTTCIEAPLGRYVYLILKGALFDGFVIMFWYLLVAPSGMVFGLGLLVFAFLWEVYSLKREKWKYGKLMPKIAGVGVTPLIQLALTGYISLYIVEHFFV